MESSRARERGAWKWPGRWPDYEPNPDWIQRFRDDPSSLASAAASWREVAVQGWYAVHDGDKPTVPPGFDSLTRLLCLWCVGVSIDSAPLLEYSAQLYARLAKMFGGGRPPHWRDSSTMETTLERAVLVIERVDDIRRLAVAQQAAALSPTDARNKFCFEQWESHHKTLKEIRVAVSKHPEWEQLADERSVRGPIYAWAKKIGATVTGRKAGRRPAAK
jgi:hypothetical protein